MMCSSAHCDTPPPPRGGRVHIARRAVSSHEDDVMPSVGNLVEDHVERLEELACALIETGTRAGEESALVYGQRLKSGVRALTSVRSRPAAARDPRGPHTALFYLLLQWRQRRSMKMVSLVSALGVLSLSIVLPQVRYCVRYCVVPLAVLLMTNSFAKGRVLGLSSPSERFNQTFRPTLSGA